MLVRPVPGAITSGFGMRFHPILGYTRMHTGVDMHAAYGEPIKAAASGRIIFAAVRGGYGNCIIIDHGGGMTTLYGHQSSLNVSYDDHVTAGDVIGYVGSSGLATGPHLHFEVRIWGKPVDPGPVPVGAVMPGEKVVARNRKARHDYEIVDTFECGIVLRGSEVKSLRNSQMELKDAYGDIRDGEVWLERAHIAPYGFSPGGGHDPERTRKLLHASQRDRPADRQGQRGRADADPAPRLLQGRQGQGGAWRSPRAPHLRQAASGSGSAWRSGRWTAPAVSALARYLRPGRHGLQLA